MSPQTKTLETYETNLRSAVTNICEVCVAHTSAERSTRIKHYLDEHCPMGAYYELTKANVSLAVSVKYHIFVDAVNLMAIGRPTIEIPPSLCGHRVTRRSGSFVCALTNNGSTWWSNSGTSYGLPYGKFIDKSLERFRTGICRRSDTADSTSPLQLGTYIDEKYSELIGREALAVVGVDVDSVRCVKPGRVIDPINRHVAVTPDVICVANETAFVSLLDHATRRDITPSDLEDGRPQLCLEIKSIHQHKNISVNLMDSEVAALESTCSSLSERDGAARALELFSSKLVAAGWTTKELTSEIGALADLDKIAKGRVSLKRIGKKASLYFNKSTKLYPTAGGELSEATACDYNVLPNIARFTQFTHEICADGKKIKSTPTTPGDDFVRLSKLCRIGGAALIVYGTDRLADEPVLRFTWDKAPFVLTPASNHFTQVLVQRSVLGQYNHGGDIASTFAVVIKRLAGDDTGPMSLGMVYVYDVGLTNYATECFRTALHRELVCALPGVYDADEYASLFADKDMSAVDWSAVVGENETDEDFANMFATSMDVENEDIGASSSDSTIDYNISGDGADERDLWLW